ncbi:MAG: glycerate kinase [Bacteroidota bacterium]
MKVLVAPDKFKGSLTAQQVCTAVKEGLLLQDASIQVACLPLADGGEGTFDILSSLEATRTKTVTVKDPLFRSIHASYGISQNGKRAFIEMASASGLQLLNETERNPLKTTSFGTGQLIADALDENVEEIILGIGGSATNDAGMGMLSALGFVFRSADAKELSPVGSSLSQISSLDRTHCHARLDKVRVTILGDVTNPLHGTEGAAHVYAPQKGASPEDVLLLDRGLVHFSTFAKKSFNIDVNFPGAGAAGGISAGALLVMNVTFQKGIDYIADRVGLEKEIEVADVVITGEGRIDEQTFSGKVVNRVMEMAQRKNKPVVLVCGQTSLPESFLTEKGVRETVVLAETPEHVAHAQQHAFNLLKEKIAGVRLA